MMDVVDGTPVAEIPLGTAIRERFANPYAVIHGADEHHALLDGVLAHSDIELCTSTRVVRVKQTADAVSAIDAHGRVHRSGTRIGRDGVKSAVREQLVGDDVRVSGHVV